MTENRNGGVVYEILLVAGRLVALRLYERYITFSTGPRGCRQKTRDKKNKLIINKEKKRATASSWELPEVKYASWCTSRSSLSITRSQLWMKGGKKSFWNMGLWELTSGFSWIAKQTNDYNFTFSIQIQVYCRYIDFKLTKPSEWESETSTSMFYSLSQIDFECWKPLFPSLWAQRVWVCVHANGCATGVHLWVVSRCNHEGSSGATLRWIHHGDWILSPRRE